VHKILKRLLPKMINAIDKKQMHNSVIMGKENASKSGIVLYWCF